MARHRDQALVIRMRLHATVVVRVLLLYAFGVALAQAGHTFPRSTGPLQRTTSAPGSLQGLSLIESTGHDDRAELSGPHAGSHIGEVARRASVANKDQLRNGRTNEPAAIDQSQRHAALDSDHDAERLHRMVTGTTAPRNIEGLNIHQGEDGSGRPRLNGQEDDFDILQAKGKGTKDSATLPAANDVATASPIGAHLNGEKQSSGSESAPNNDDSDNLKYLTAFRDKLFLFKDQLRFLKSIQYKNRFGHFPTEPVS